MRDISRSGIFAPLTAGQAKAHHGRAQRANGSARAYFETRQTGCVFRIHQTQIEPQISAIGQPI